MAGVLKWKNKYTQTDRSISNIAHNCFIDNKITQFVILNSPQASEESLSRNDILSLFLGQMLRFAQHDNSKPVSLSKYS